MHQASVIPLVSLSAVFLDTETTGLDVARDRIVQMGALRIIDGQIDAGDAFDRLVNPGIAIPETSQRIHGISDDDVRSAEDFAAVARAYDAWAGGDIIIGYSIGFDLGILAAEYDRHGLDWQAPQSLDVKHLVELLKPNLPNYGLETVAAWLGTTSDNRHTAFGDALMTAKVFIALAPKLAEKGVVNLAQARRACQRLSAVLDEETQAGWSPAAKQPLSQFGDYARIDSFPFRHRVNEVMNAPALSVAATTKLKQAIAAMMENAVSSIFIEPAEAHQPYGILTERDALRATAAHGTKALSQAISKFASYPLISIHGNDFVYEAIARMAGHDFRHLGVVDGDGRLIGAITARNLLKQRSQDAIILDADITAATSPGTLGRVWSRLAAVAGSLLAEEVDARHIAAVISRELCALTAKACEMAESELVAAGRKGPPVEYAMLVLGSGGRGESLLAMDQDNAVIFAAGGEQYDDWFAELGKRTADILHSVGVPLCKGGIMAANEDWRGTVADWRQRLRQWLSRSAPKDILNSDIFFDCICVHGSGELLDELRSDALKTASQSGNFLHMLAMNAADFKTPLGWFGRIDSENGRTDLKMAGLLPIFSAARVLALKYGIKERSTPQRLARAKEHLNDKAYLIDDLIQAHRLFLTLILRQQLKDLEAGIALSNNVVITDLSKLDKKQLVWALEKTRSIPDLLGVNVGV